MEFIVARNPDPESKLPYLLLLPLEGGVWLKARETWPRTTRVYCHPADAPRLEDVEVLERVPVVACQRRGPAIDLVLARGINKRSQFVHTTFRGRAMILWQTPKVATTARPGLRIPFSRSNATATFLIDTRERYGYTFSGHHVDATRRALRAGDYAVEHDGAIVAAVERKRMDDFIKSLVDGSLNYVAAELAHVRSAAIVVEGMYSALLRHEYSRAGFLAELLARVQVRYPNVPIVFAESRKLGEEWTFRFLNAAHSEGAAAPLLSAMIPDYARAKPARKKRKPRTPTESKPGSADVGSNVEDFALARQNRRKT